MAVDHLIHTRVIRDGKVTGRHDIRRPQLESVAEGLKELWMDLGLPGEPQNCIPQNADVDFEIGVADMAYLD